MRFIRAHQGRHQVKMKIGIIGAGHIGSTLARHFTNAGHEVAISNSRGPESLTDLAAEVGAQPATVEQAASFGDIVVVAIPFKDYRDVPADAVRGKVVIDVMNYYPSRDGNFAALDSGETTSSGLLAQHLPGAFVVKAFNTIRWDSLRDKARPGAADRHIGIPISGDDEAAKQEVDDLLAEIGFDGVDAGTLAEGGRKHQPGTAVYGAELPSADLAERIAA
jgi:predicted dinucleotide-binding enzyme